MPDDRPKYTDTDAPLDDRDYRHRWLATLYDRDASGLYRYALMLLGD